MEILKYFLIYGLNGSYHGLCGMGWIYLTLAFHRWSKQGLERHFWWRPCILTPSQACPEFHTGKHQDFKNPAPCSHSHSTAELSCFQNESETFPGEPWGKSAFIIILRHHWPFVLAFLLACGRDFQTCTIPTDGCRSDRRSQWPSIQPETRLTWKSIKQCHSFLLLWNMWLLRLS